jgi:hypothetical protein
VYDDSQDVDEGMPGGVSSCSVALPVSALGMWPVSVLWMCGFCLAFSYTETFSEQYPNERLLFILPPALQKEE